MMHNPALMIGELYSKKENWTIGLLLRISENGRQIFQYTHPGSLDPCEPLPVSVSIDTLQTRTLASCSVSKVQPLSE